ncbi:MAG: hypothetical protein ACRELC_09615, partial [Gemmatimonadota bacterium]
FLGAEGPGDVQRSGALIAGYSLVHGLAFWVAGVVLVGVARQLERLPSLAYLAVLAFILLEAVSLGVLVAFGGWVLGTVSVWAIGIGNLLAVLGMAAWIWRSHPRLRERVRREGFASTA